MPLYRRVSERWGYILKGDISRKETIEQPKGKVEGYKKIESRGVLSTSEAKSYWDSKVRENKKTESATEKSMNELARGVDKTERMEPPIVIKFKCPEGFDRKEFYRQVKDQERGLNSQTIAENISNRESFEKRKEETGVGRDINEGNKNQDIARQKALQQRIESNQDKGMTYVQAKSEAEGWIKTQAALHNPDQIAGGRPDKVSRMGDAKVNSSIGGQWKARVDQLAKGISEYAEGKSQKELENTKLNVKLEVE